MIGTLIAFVAISAVAVTLGYLVIWSRRALAPRVAAVALSIGLIGVLGASLVDQLGRPKPLRVEWTKSTSDDVDVLGSRIVEGQGIYLWLGFPGEAEPRAYVLPWSTKTANDLQKALEEASKDGGTARAQIPFERSWEVREPKFYAMPQPKLPNKPAPKAPEHFEQDA